MEDNKVFRFLWRFNALVIAIAGLLAVLVLAFAGYAIFNEMTGVKQQREIVNIDPDSDTQESYRLGSAKSISGSDSVVIPLHSDQKFSLSYSGRKATVSTRNLLFSNLQSRQNQWLLPSNESLISEYRFLNISSSWDESKEVLSILYQIVKADTNGDKRLTHNDAVSVFLSRPDGAQFTEVINEVDSVLGYEVLNKDLVALVFNRAGNGYIAYISLDNFKVLEEVVLPKVGE